MGAALDWVLIIDALGGGLSAAVIAALAWTCWHLLKRVDAIQDARVQDQKDANATLLEGIRGMDEAIRALESVKAQEPRR